VYERDACNPVQKDIEDKEKGDENRRQICAEHAHPPDDGHFRAAPLRFFYAHAPGRLCLRRSRPVFAILNVSTARYGLLSGACRATYKTLYRIHFLHFNTIDSNIQIGDQLEFFKALRIILLAGIVLLGAVQTAAAATEPTVALSTDKDVYATGETIYPTITVTDTSYDDYVGALSVEYWIQSQDIYYDLTEAGDFTHTGELTAPAVEGQYTLTAQFRYNENGTNKILIQTTTVHTKIDVQIPEFASIAIPASIVLVGGLLFMRRKED